MCEDLERFIPDSVSGVEQQRLIDQPMCRCHQDGPENMATICTHLRLFMHEQMSKTQQYAGSTFKMLFRSYAK